MSTAPVTGGRTVPVPGAEAAPLPVLTSDLRSRYPALLHAAWGGAATVTEWAGAGLPPAGEVFHLHWPEHFLGADVGRHRAAAAALAGTGTPVVWTQHNLRPHDPAGRVAEHRAVYEIWAGAAHTVLHHSRWGEARVREEYPFRPDAVHRVVPHPHLGPLLTDPGSHPADERGSGPPSGPRSGAIRLVVVGAPRPGKDVDLVLRGVAGTRRTDLELRTYSGAVGDPPPPDDERIVAEPYAPVDRRTWDERLRAADAIVMPFDGSHMLTTGTVGDAVAHGLPCLVSDWPFLTEILGDAAIPYGRTARDLTRCVDSLDGARLAAAARAARALRAVYAPARIAALVLDALSAASTTGRPGRGQAGDRIVVPSTSARASRADGMRA